MLLSWFRQRRLQDADAQDLTQEVLVRLADRLRSFQYDAARSFRGYLKTMAHHAWCDLLQARSRSTPGSGDSVVLQLLNDQSAPEELTQRFAREYDLELLERAQLQVQLRVEPRTWEAFRLTAHEGLSGSEVAKRVGMSVVAVFKAKSKVQKMLQEIVQQFDHDTESQTP